ncbi:hypothetical protein KBD13_01525 [Patescibacteria group bacterium]|nr:hypothetical protein [Patescibacteria group bacterium]MDQ5919417.1 hypothetical protein [Patescibacteria group bacterium]
MRAWHPVLLLTGLMDDRVAELRRFLLSSGGVCEWTGEGSVPRWMKSALQAGYTFLEVWEGISSRLVLPSEVQRHTTLVGLVRSWRSSVERWRVHVPDGRAEASTEQLVRWKAGLSDLLTRVLRGIYCCLRAGYGVWQWVKAVGRAIQLHGRAGR